MSQNILLKPMLFKKKTSAQYDIDIKKDTENGVQGPEISPCIFG